MFAFAVTVIVAVHAFVLFVYQYVKCVPLVNVVALLLLGIGTVTPGVGVCALPLYVTADTLAIVALLKLYWFIFHVTVLFDVVQSLH